MQQLTISEAQQKVDEWIKTYGVKYFGELTNLGILMEEVGELSRFVSSPKYFIPYVFIHSSTFC